MPEAVTKIEADDDEYFNVVIETDLADVKLFNKNGEALFYEQDALPRRRGIKNYFFTDIQV